MSRWPEIRFTRTSLPPKLTCLSSVLGRLFSGTSAGDRLRLRSYLCLSGEEELRCNKEVRYQISDKYQISISAIDMATDQKLGQKHLAYQPSDLI